MPTVDALANQCIEGAFDLTSGTRCSRRWRRHSYRSKIPRWLNRGNLFSYKTLPAIFPTELPVFIAQGTADGLVRPAVTQAYKERLCKAGSKVKLLMLQGVSHGFAGYDSADAAVDWMADRFKGNAPPSDC